MKARLEKVRKPQRNEEGGKKYLLIVEQKEEFEDDMTFRDLKMMLGRPI